MGVKEDMETLASSLLFEIAHCPHVQACRENPKSKNPCQEIIDFQNSPDLNNFQVPEPWSGQIEQAPILFLSSNPSLSSDEAYPTWNWENSEIHDYFNYRFGGGSKDWIISGTKSLLKNGQYGRSTKFWAAVQKRAIELMQRDVVPGTDYALTEIVHCKSHKEIGVAQAQEQCVKTYLQRILELSSAKVIVVLGAHARQVIQKQFNIPQEVSVSQAFEIGGRLRLFAFLPHPNARSYRSFTKCLQPDELKTLRLALR